MWDSPLSTWGRRVTAVVPWLWQQQGGKPEAGTWFIWAFWCWQPVLSCGAAVGWGMWRDQLAQLDLGSIPYLPGWQHRVRLWEGRVG